MANPTGSELLTVQGVQSNGQPAATTEVFTLNQLGLGPVLFGGGTATLEESGNIYVASGNPVSNPGAITTDSVLAVYTIPAGSFSAAGKGVEFQVSGNFANNSHTKECKLIWNASSAVVGSAVGTNSTSFLLGDTGAVTNPNVGWSITSQVYKYGAAGSNTQIGQELGVIVGSTHGGLSLASALTTNESLPILVAVTGNATSSVGDISLYNVNYEAFN